jgi:glycosyltransferase involved in cell wall biosynthesis
MACGKPVIACKAGGVSELLGDSGLLLEPDPQLWQETLGRLMNDSNLRKKLGSNALERSMKYSWESTTNSMLNAFSNFLHSDEEGKQV